jgi:hypothetical protein
MALGLRDQGSRGSCRREMNFGQEMENEVIYFKVLAVKGSLIWWPYLGTSVSLVKELPTEKSLSYETSQTRVRC